MRYDLIEQVYMQLWKLPIQTNGQQAQFLMIMLWKAAAHYESCAVSDGFTVSSFPVCNSSVYLRSIIFVIDGKELNITVNNICAECMQDVLWV
jgi:hypothetical protein